jgi:hypothetical protein
MSNQGKLPIPSRIAVLRGTRADTDEQLLKSWLDSLVSPHTRRNFEMTARRFLEALPMGLRSAAVEDVREALGKVTHGVGDATARQYVLRVKSLLGFAPFNAGATIKVRSRFRRPWRYARQADRQPRRGRDADQSGAIEARSRAA